MREIADLDRFEQVQQRSPDFDALIPPQSFSPEQESVFPPLGNPELPIYERKTEIVDTINNNRVTILSAETGAGKSTQLAQYLLEAGYKTVHLTQPRRLASKNVFERIDYELKESLGEENGEGLVSFQTAAGLTGSPDAKIKIVTDGLQLVKEFNGSGFGEDEVLIIDEVHEWNTNIEILVAWTKRALAENPNLKVVLSSATMETQSLADYFADVCDDEPPILEVKGKPHQVTMEERPESTVVDEIIKAAKEINEALRNNEDPSQILQNGILAFMPGKQQIDDAIDEIWRRLPPDIARMTNVFGLDASMTPEEQQKAIESYAGIKIVVATNVAQTSLTIPDIGWVIDSGYERRQELDENGVSGLMLRPTSVADCLQRAGRTGRVAAGKYILTRMSKGAKFVGLHDERRPEYPIPEILSTDLDRTVLRVAGVGLNLADLELYHTLNKQAIAQAQYNLNLLGALDDQDVITEIGEQMNVFPVLPSSGRMLVEAKLASERVRNYLSIIAAAREAGSLKKFRANNEDPLWKKLSHEKRSDLLAELDIYLATQGQSTEFLYAYDLDINNINKTEELRRKIAHLYGIDADDELPPPSQAEREELLDFIHTGYAHSIFLPTGGRGGTYKQFNGSDLPREISNRSVTVGSVKPLVGEARRVEITRAGKLEIKQIIEGATEISEAEIGRLAVRQAVWMPEKYTMRNGTFRQKEKKYLGHLVLGEREIPAEPSPQLRAAVIEHVKANPGKTLQMMRQVKRELEKLADLTKIPIPRLTEDQILDYIHEATPADVDDPSLVENNLRLIAAREGIEKAKYVTPEEEARIVAAAPKEFWVAGKKLTLSYDQGKPSTKIFDDNIPSDWLDSLEEDPTLPDGRTIFFRYTHGKALTLVQLRRQLAENGLL